MYLFHQAPNRLWFRVSSESTDSKISSGIIWQKLRGRECHLLNGQACVHIGNLQGTSLTRKTHTDLPPTSPTTTPTKHIIKLPHCILTLPKTRRQIYFLKITAKTKNSSSNQSSLIKTFLGTLQFLFPVYKRGLMSYLWFPGSREKALVRLFLDQISYAVVQIQTLALWYWHLGTWVFWTQ